MKARIHKHAAVSAFACAFLASFIASTAGADVQLFSSTFGTSDQDTVTVDSWVDSDGSGFDAAVRTDTAERISAANPAYGRVRAQENLTRTVSTVGYKSVHIRFVCRGDTDDDSTDSLIVRIDLNNDNDFSDANETATSFTVDTTGTTGSACPDSPSNAWSGVKDIDLSANSSANNNANFKIRFFGNVSSSDTNERTHMDDVEVRATLACGDGVKDSWEACDDGNTTNGDCCSSTCAFEANGAACTSDSNVCTNDTCNATGTCQHTNNTASCNDGLFCNGTDTCSGGTCGHAGDPCPGPDGDGNCAESCNETADNCTANDANGSACNDGLFCNGTDTCSAGACSGHTGDPCSGGAQCQNVCNESVDSCNAPAGTACGSASDTACDNPDSCNATGSCLTNHEPSTTACRSDAGECDVAETCDGAGACPANSFEPAGTACGSASDTVCDNPDTCNASGSCLSNLEPATTVCRSDAGDCDVAENCDGAGACPTDSFAPSGTACGNHGEGICDDADTCNATGTCQPNHKPATYECRPDAGDCDVAENCDGAGACPADALEPVGTACGDTADTACDNPDTCDAGGACQPNYEASTTECRADAGTCDVAENCDGAGECAADAFEAAGTACGSASDTVCDNPDSCNATGACLPNYEPTTTECRADAGECDVAESCDGAGACPANGFSAAGTACGSASDTVCDNPDTCNAAGACLQNHEPGTTECRADAGDCDVAESCDSAGACPANGFSAAGTACGSASDTVCDNPDTCNAAGACLQNHEPGTTECRADAGDCDVAESCDGAGACHANGFSAAGTACGSAGDTVCDNPDTCNATGACLPNPEPTTTECRADTGDCDVAENCNGAGACPANGFSPAGTACGSASDTVCDNPNTCNAVGVCLSNFEPTTTECRADAGDCDVAENCNGAGACPANGFSPAGTACGSASDTVCDNPNTCNAAGACLPNFEPASTQCRPSAGDCDVAESCTGSSAACPADQFLAAGMDCRAPADSCDAPALCNGTSSECPANDPAPNGTACDDGDACTGPDVCQAGTCTSSPNVNLCVDSRLCYKSKFSGFASLPTMTLSDFETIGADVSGAGEFCTAADRDGEGTGEPDIYLVAYKIETADGWPNHAPRTMVMHNDFGDISLTTVKPEFLLVPSAEDPDSAPPPPAFDSHTVDHYKCYKAGVTKGMTGLPKGTTVSVADVFSNARTLALKKPKHLCTPVDREGDGIKNANGYLVCYQGKPAKGQPKHPPQAGLRVTNPLSGLVATTVREAEVCIPSTLVP